MNDAECPYCKRNFVPYDVGFGETEEYECPHCGKIMKLTSEAEVYYYTEKKDGE